MVAPHLALLHSRPEDGVLQPGFALVTLKHPVPFGNRNNDPVSLVISIAAVDAIQPPPGAAPDGCHSGRPGQRAGYHPV